MRFLINSFRRLTNLFGVQFLSLRNYKKLTAYQTAMTQLGVRHTQLDVFINAESNYDVRAQTEKFAEVASSNDSYFSKLNKALKQNTGTVSNNSGNSIEDTHMAQYNEGRIARMLLQEKLTSLELSKGSRAKAPRR